MYAQAIGLRNLFPNGETVLRRRQVGWKGELSPDEYGRVYDVEMHYSVNGSPRVWVRSPDLHALTGGRRLPHVYDQIEQRLCLYAPGFGCWTPSRAVCRTILPWTCYWLRLFELWLVTDVWHERGIHPTPRQTRTISPATISF
jgi:hypothetical protein